MYDLTHLCTNFVLVCDGTITRYREIVNTVEEAVRDHFMGCEEFFKHISKMGIDKNAAKMPSILITKEVTKLW